MVISCAKVEYMSSFPRLDFYTAEYISRIHRIALHLLLSAFPNLNRAINRGSYHTAVLWMVTYTRHLDQKTNCQSMGYKQRWNAERGASPYAQRKTRGGRNYHRGVSSETGYYRGIYQIPEVYIPVLGTTSDMSISICKAAVHFIWLVHKSIKPEREISENKTELQKQRVDLGLKKIREMLENLSYYELSSSI